MLKVFLVSAILYLEKVLILRECRILKDEKIRKTLITSMLGGTVIISTKFSTAYCT